MTDKQEQELLSNYAALIHDSIMSMFNDDAEFKISQSDLLDDEKATLFFHALANITPTLLYNSFTQNELSILDFNHIANRLIFQFAP